MGLKQFYIYKAESKNKTCESKNKTISINLNQSNNYCSRSLKNKDLIPIKLLKTTYYLHFLCYYFCLY